MKLTIAGFVSALSLVFLLTGCGASKDKAAEIQVPAEHADALGIYKQKCISCHGGNLEGRMGPTTNLQKVGSRLTKEQITEQIVKGGRGMPDFKGNLNEKQIDALANWLVTMQ